MNKIRKFKLGNAYGFMATFQMVAAWQVLAQSETVRLTVDAANPGARINSAMWGVFFEDINFGADGGIYAELVKNRSFEFPNAMTGWFKVSPSNARGEVAIKTEDPFSASNPHYVRIESEANPAIGISNEGFRGMGVREGEAYHFSTQARQVSGSPRMLVELISAEGETLAQDRIESLTGDWKEMRAVLRPSKTDAKARLTILLEGQGTVDFDMVSLFPEKTWKRRPGGLRADMVQLLADMKPGFLRFPGGCIVEGSDLEKRYQWKTTIGPIEQRKLIINRWNYEFRHRPTPDYYQSFGLGFFEFFQLSEDIGASPMPILNCGMACQFNSGQLVPMSELDPYIQDALDLIEFANGPVTSTWGAKRAAMGHPEPFNMTMLGVGNEQWGPQYVERFAAFAKVLKVKHPEILLIGDSGPSPADDRFDFLWPKMVELKAEVVDQHCYANPIWFFSSVDRFDSYDRNGPKVFFGEYAAQSDKIVSIYNRNNWECALSEAAFMTGMERNADIVRMASYAPLFAHADAWQWTPNLIWADNLRVYGTPNYHVQALFSRNRGDVVLPVKLDRGDTPSAARGGIGLGTYRTAAEFKDVKVTREGETLFSGSENWNLPRGWEQSGGVLKQPDRRGTSTSTIGDDSWTDYTVTLKARKLSGSEGFIVVVRSEQPNTRVQWNVGGWGNTRHGIQSTLGVQDSLINQVDGSVEAERWYDLKIELKGESMKCYLDGKLVQSAQIPIPRHGGFFASAVKDEDSGEVILKLVNATPESRTAAIRLDGVRRIRDGASSILLKGDRLHAVNDFEQPDRVKPEQKPLNVTSASFEQIAPANSFLVLKVPVAD